MGKYAEDAKQLLRLVGGKENIAAGIALHDKNAICLGGA